MNRAEPARSRRMPGLDGLRAVSVLLVIFYHLGLSPQFPKTHWLLRLSFESMIGLQIFFVISGFLITWLLIDEERKRGSISLKYFYLRRALRILPPVFVYLLTLRVLAYLGFFQFGWRDVAIGALFVRNVITPGPLVTNHLWTLAIEEQFYLLWPFLVVLVRPMRGRIVLILAAILLAPLWRYVHDAHLMGLRDMSVWRFDQNCDSLLAGCLLGLLRQDSVTSPHLRGRLLQNKWALMLAILVGIAAIVQPFHNSMLSRCALPTVRGLVIAVAVNFAVEGHDTWMDRLLNFPPMMWVGRLSYSLYLWQQLFCSFEPWHFYNRIPLNLFMALGCAAASYYLLEQPLARLRSRLERATHTATLPAVALSP
jgi:peptidoglycan/LPS O-acetylase OafA/YrhL